jgi:hypothetical protein
MDNSLRTIVDRQVRRVRRRLLLKSLIHHLMLSWAAALVLAAVWFMTQPLAFAGMSDAGRWGVPGLVLGLGTLVGMVFGWMRTPNLVASALALDEQFALRERVTTLLTLPPDLALSPAGQALLADVGPRVEKLAVGARFPLMPSWRTGVWPLGGMALALAALFIQPLLSNLHFTQLAAAPVREQKVDAKEIQQQLDNLRDKLANDKKNPDADKSEKMKELLDEWEKLVNKPVDPSDPEQVRERLAEMRTLEQKMKERAHDLKASAQKNDTLRKLLEKLAEDGRKLKEGPAKDFEDALIKGQFHKAKEALDKLAQQLRDNKLTPQQQKEIADQFKQLQEKIQRVMEKDEKLKQAKKDFEEGRITKEQLDKEMEKNKQLQELANLLGECKECLSQDAGEAATALAKMAKQFEQAELTEDELNEILRNMEALNEAALGIGDALGDGEDGNGMNGGDRPGGRRPIDPNDPNSKIINQRQKAEVNPNSQQRITGFTTGGNFNKIPAKEVDGAFRQARQDAPEAIERQNIPEDAAGIARGYFKKLGGQK